jgi:integrase
MAPRLPPFVVKIRKPNGRLYYYLQRHRGTTNAEGRARLPDIEAHDFWQEYALLSGVPIPKANANAISALVSAWQASPEWRGMAAKTRKEWERYSRRIAEVLGEFDVRIIKPKHVIALRDKYADTPAAANNLVRCLSAMMRWGVLRDWREDNPCREVPMLDGEQPYEPWPWHVIDAAKIELEARRPDLWWAIALALYTGQRQSDVLPMRWDAIQSGMIAVRQEKTDKRLAIPLHRDLKTVLDTIPKRAVTILTSSDGVPWRTGFRSSWKKYGPAAANGYVFHGLRKSAVVTLLECGASTAETSAITGQSLQMVEHYAKGVNQSRMAVTAMGLWERGRG